jgi:hypothetical protein
MVKLISLNGLDKAAVFAALYNGAKAQGLGFLSYDPEPMTPEQAREQFGDCNGDYDYINGRVMKVDLSGEAIDPSGYDRDNGNGSAARIVEELRETNSVSLEEALTAQKTATRKAAQHMREHLSDEATIDDSGDVMIFTLGVSDIADDLKPHIDAILDE